MVRKGWLLSQIDCVVGRKSQPISINIKIHGVLGKILMSQHPKCVKQRLTGFYALLIFLLWQNSY